jgi:hypothetical protein
MKGEKMGNAKTKKPDAGCCASGLGGSKPRQSGFGFGLDDFASAVETGGADVVAQVHFTSGGLERNTGYDQGIVRAVHAALRRGFFVLLDCHGGLLNENAAQGRRKMMGFA